MWSSRVVWERWPVVAPAAIIGLVVGGIALVLSGLSLATRRKSTGTASS